MDVWLLWHDVDTALVEPVGYVETEEEAREWVRQFEAQNPDEYAAMTTQLNRDPPIPAAKPSEAA